MWALEKQIESLQLGEKKTTQAQCTKISGEKEASRKNCEAARQMGSLGKHDSHTNQQIWVHDCLKAYERLIF